MREPCFILGAGVLVASWATAAFRDPVPGVQQMRCGLEMLAEGRPGIEQALGREDFDHPGSRQLLEHSPCPPDIVHTHNLHGYYFDLRSLATLSHQAPAATTLHDEWMITGHCAYTLGCPRWEHGCGQRPDLAVYPALRRDGTAYNWRRKSDLRRKPTIRGNA